MKLKSLKTKITNSDRTAMAKNIAGTIKKKSIGDYRSAITASEKAKTNRALDEQFADITGGPLKPKEKSLIEKVGDAIEPKIGGGISDYLKLKRKPQGQQSGSSDTSDPEDKSNIRTKVGGRK